MAEQPRIARLSSESALTLLQSLLVQVVADETDRASQHEHAVQGADLDVLLCLFVREQAGMP